MTKSPFNEVVQISFATHDLDRLMQTWNDKYGVGPWEVLDFTADRMTDCTVDGQPATFGMRLARAKLGHHVVIELMEPLDNESIYARSLGEHNGADHVHHIMCTTGDYDATLAHYQAMGVGNSMGGNFNGLEFAYLDTVKDLGIWIELSKVPNDFTIPPADAVYPPGSGGLISRRPSGADG